METPDYSRCTVYLLGNLPGFVKQRSIESESHIFELYPRYHCEYNQIEPFWGATKKVARQNCNCNFRLLDNNINGFLDGVSPPGEVPLQIGRYFNKNYRYIEVYNPQKDATSAFAIVKDFSKKQKSHRKLREN